MTVMDEEEKLARELAIAYWGVIDCWAALSVQDRNNFRKVARLVLRHYEKKEQP